MNRFEVVGVALLTAVAMAASMFSLGVLWPVFLLGDTSFSFSANQLIGRVEHSLVVGAASGFFVIVINRLPTFKRR